MRYSATLVALLSVLAHCGSGDETVQPSGAGGAAGADAAAIGGSAGLGGSSGSGGLAGSGGSSNGGAPAGGAAGSAALPDAGTGGSDAAKDAVADSTLDAPRDSAGSDAARTDGSFNDARPPDARPPDAGAGEWLAGVNLSCAEFGSAVPGTYGTTYTYPTHAEIDYFVGKGMKLFRVPFLWGRLQRTLGGALDATELGRIDDVVSYATGRGAKVIIDPHNYARYGSAAIGAGLSSADFADLWSRLGAHFKGNGGAIFGLMNEPHDVPSAAWGSAANAAIAAIRQAGAPNLVLVPGNCWTGAHSWTSCDQGASAVAMQGIVDTGNNYAFEVHQYLDADSSGTSATCVDGAIGSQRLAAFTQWARNHGARAVLGEFAGGDNATCDLAVSDMLAFMRSNRDVWIGFTWWAAGPWWGEYMFTLEPKQGVDRPQMRLLTAYM